LLLELIPQLLSKLLPACLLTVPLLVAMPKILIAEDEARLAAFIAKGLQKSGFDTVIAEDGLQALQMAENGEFELILLDLGLPLKDGWAVLKEIRSLGKQLPIIIVTALNNEDRYRSQALAFGANDYVSKPFRFNELLQKVQLQLQ
jgi:two-component system, OmpR family, copper resistance phosphate regulon response regulator CusR